MDSEPKGLHQQENHVSLLLVGDGIKTLGIGPDLFTMPLDALPPPPPRITKSPGGHTAPYRGTPYVDLSFFMEF